MPLLQATRPPGGVVGGMRRGPMVDRRERMLGALVYREVKPHFGGRFLVFYSMRRLPSEAPPYKIEDLGELHCVERPQALALISHAAHAPPQGCRAADPSRFAKTAARRPEENTRKHTEMNRESDRSLRISYKVYRGSS